MLWQMHYAVPFSPSACFHRPNLWRLVGNVTFVSTALVPPPLLLAIGVPHGEKGTRFCSEAARTWAEDASCPVRIITGRWNTAGGLHAPFQSEGCRIVFQARLALLPVPR